MKPRHSQEVKAAANKRFSELAMPMTVSAELKIPYDTIYGWWRKHQGHPITRKAKVSDADRKAALDELAAIGQEMDNADPGDAQNGGGC